MAHRDKERKTINTKTRKEIFKRDKYICGYCGVKKKLDSLAIDHIIPVRYGGFHGAENFVTACRKCNRKKWLYGPKEKGVPKLIWHRGKEVAKTTWLAKGKKFPKRIPKISYKKPKN
jgi:5-methylcytosine-specific restriction endonuclease McrA